MSQLMNEMYFIIGTAYSYDKIKLGLFKLLFEKFKKSLSFERKN